MFRAREMSCEAKKKYLRSSFKAKVMNPKYPKHCIFVCSCRILNRGLNHGLYLSLFKFFGWKYVEWIQDKKIRLLNIFRPQVCFFEVQAILPETSPFLSAQMAVLSSFFQMFIVLRMYNFYRRWKSNEKEKLFRQELESIRTIFQL